MITIDGKEGGGQILRTAIGLSVVTGKPIKVVNIRGARCGAGLRPQHLMGVKAAGEFCGAEIKGLKIGSTEIEFIPKSLRITDKKIDIGTAGSISLLLQTLTPILIFSNKKVTVEIIGGTDVPWSPTINYYQQIFCDFMKKIGAEIDVEIIKYGFYPKGGGKVRVTFNPMKKLKPLSLTERGKLLGIDAWSIASEDLKKARVAERQVEGLKMDLVNVFATYVKTFSPGSSLNVFANFENCRMGANSLGKKGKPAEKVGEEAAEELKKSIESKAVLDKHMADQILIYLALCKSESRITVEKITEHCLTNIYVIEKILNVKFEVKGEKGNFGEISVRPL